MILVLSGIHSHSVQYMQKAHVINVSVSHYSRNTIFNIVDDWKNPQIKQTLVFLCSAHLRLYLLFYTVKPSALLFLRQQQRFSLAIAFSSCSLYQYCPFRINCSPSIVLMKVCWYFMRIILFYVYVFECFILEELCKLVTKTVCKLAYKQILETICTWSNASIALKGFYWFLFVFSGQYRFILPTLHWQYRSCLRG